MVRTFPSDPRNNRVTWLVAIVVAVALAAISAAVIPAAADDLRNKQKKVGQAIKSATHDVEESSQELARARTRLATAQQSLSRAQATLRGTQTKLNAAKAADARMQAALTRANTKLVKARADLKAAVAEVLRQRNEMASLVALNYQQGNPELIGLAAMLRSGDPAVITSQVNTVHNLMNRQAGMLDDLRAAEDRAQVLEKQVYDLREAAAKRKVEAAELVARRTSLEKRAATERAKVATLVGARSVARASASKALAADRKILRKLKAEDLRIKRILAARSNSGGNNHTGSSNGYLTRPVPGYVTSPYGYRVHPIYGYYGLHDGTDFHAPCGQDMRAVADGTVVSSYWSDVYGNRLVLDVGRVNGKSVAAVYNHASGYRVGVGAHVRRGQVIGDAGSTGWSTGCHLHFTLMVNGNTTDPMPWF